jgi:O-antigen ligase
MKSPLSRKQVHRKIFYFLMVIIVFFLPIYGKIVPPLIILLAANWLIEGSYIKTFPLLFRERKRTMIISFALLYLLYLIGLSYTSNMHAGGLDVQTKLSLIIFPLIFATSDPLSIKKDESASILLSFVAGCFASALLLFGHAAFSATVNHYSGAFYHTRLSWLHTPCYIAMYLTFGIAVLSFWLIEDKHNLSRFRQSGIMILITVFFVCIFLLVSKAGYISIFLIVFFYSFILVRVKHNWAGGLGSLLLSSLLFCFMLWLFPFPGQRLNQAREDIKNGGALPGDTTKSTADRMMILKVSAEIIKEHPLIGVGTGDTKEALREKYQGAGMTKALKRNFNAHNQYIETSIALGFPGLIALLYILLVPVIPAFRRKDYIYLMFLLIFAVNIMFESMLERQAGVIFYALFNVLLYISDGTDDPGNPFNIFHGKSRS